MALHQATTAATARATSSPEPAAAAAGANAANTPAPSIDPSPMTTASARPSRRASPGCGAGTGWSRRHPAPGPPYREPGEGRRPTLTWPREIPIDGVPADVAGIVAANAAWMATSPCRSCS